MSLRFPGISSNRVSPNFPKVSEPSSRSRPKSQDSRQPTNAGPLPARASRHAESEKTARRRSSSTIDSLARMTRSALKTTKKETGKFFTKTMGKLEKAMQSSSSHSMAHEETDEERYYGVRMPTPTHVASPAPAPRRQQNGPGERLVPSQTYTRPQTRAEREAAEEAAAYAPSGTRADYSDVRVTIQRPGRHNASPSRSSAMSREEAQRRDHAERDDHQDAIDNGYF